METARALHVQPMLAYNSTRKHLSLSLSLSFSATQSGSFHFYIYLLTFFFLIGLFIDFSIIIFTSLQIFAKLLTHLSLTVSNSPFLFIYLYNQSIILILHPKKKKKLILVLYLFSIIIIIIIQLLLLFYLLTSQFQFLRKKKKKKKHFPKFLFNKKISYFYLLCNGSSCSSRSRAYWVFKFVLTKIQSFKS